MLLNDFSWLTLQAICVIYLFIYDFILKYNSTTEGLEQDIGGSIVIPSLFSSLCDIQCFNVFLNKLFL